MEINKEKVRKILIIKLRGIGDVILSTVVFDNLRKDFPHAKIDYLTEKPSKTALEKIPFINNIELSPKGSFIEDVKLIFRIRRNKYDLVFDFYSNPRTAIITFLSGAKYRAGFPYRGRKYAYNLFGPAERNIYHAGQLHLEFLRCLGLRYDEKIMHFGLTEEDRLFAKEYFADKFSEGEFVVGLSPSGGWNSKKAEPAKFAEIGNEILKRYPAKLLVLWGPGDQNDALEICQLLRGKGVIAPLTDIRKMAALLEKCSMVIANDSGPMHISTAVGTPTLSMHGPTSPHMQGPFGDKHEWVRLDELECIECNLLECPRNHECFKNLPVERVMAKVESLIRKNNISIPSLNEKI